MLALGAVDGTLAITGRGLTRGAVGGAAAAKGLLTEGNALMNLGFAASSVFGAALAGALIAAFGVSVALLVDAASFALIAVVLVVARDLPEPEHEDRTPWRERFVDGLEFVRDFRPVRTLLIGQSLALICFTIVVPIEVIYAKESLGTTNAGFGILMSSWGAGIVIGSLLFLLLKRRSGLLIILISSAAVGFAYLGMSQAGTLAVACAFSVLGGAGNGVQWVAVMTALQEATPPEFQARMAGLLESLGAAMPGVGFLLGGTIVALGSPRTAFAIAGAGILVRGGGGRDPAAGASDLDDDRQHHRAALEPVVDELRQVVVQVRLQDVGLGDLLLGGAVERILDRLAQLVDEGAVALQERDAARDHLGRDDGRAVLLGDRRDDDEDAVRAEHPAVAQRDVGHVADVDAVDEDHPD